MSELERLRTEIDDASRAVAELTRDVEQLTEQRASAEAEAEAAARALLDAERDADSVSFGAQVTEKLGQGWGCLGKVAMMVPVLLVVGVIASAIFEGPDVTTDFSIVASGSLVRSDGPPDALGGACDISVVPLGDTRYHAVLACDGHELYDDVVGCALDRRCEGSGDDETCWDAAVVRNDVVGHGFFYDSDVGLVQADASGVRVVVAVHVVEWSGEP